MKGWIRTITIFATLMITADCQASYAIETKNGTIFVTDQYWRDNGRIHFSYLNGKISLDREEIETIKKSDAPVASGKPKTSVSGEKAAQYKAALKQNQTELMIQREIFRLAKGHKQKPAKDTAWSRLSDLKAEREKLRARVLDLYGGTLPEWWHNILENKQFFTIKDDRAQH